MRFAFVPLLAAVLVVASHAGAVADTFGLRPGIVPDDLLNTDDTPPPQPRRPSADDPYAALGIRAADFILYPSLTFGVGATTNATNSAGGTAAGFGTVAPELDIRSNWDRNAATLVLRGSYEKFLDDVAADQPTGSAEGTAHIDFADQWNADFAAGALYDEQSLSDPNYPAGADKPPGVISLTSSAALNGNFGRAMFTVAGSADHTIYEDAKSGGVTIDQGDRTNTLYSARLRLGYEVDASLTPFVEGEVSRRDYDRAIDDEGFERSGTALGLRAGVALDRDPFLKGELSVGTIRETFDDSRLAPLQGLTVDGSLAWSPTRLLTVTLAGNTGLNPTTDITSSGSVLYNASVDAAYAWRRNVTIDLTGGVTNERFQGTGEVDNTYRTGVAATWKVNRDMQLTGSYIHEWMNSTDPGLPYQSDTVQAELRFQR